MASGLKLLQLFIGVTALIGGYKLLSDPTGAVLGLNTGILAGSPFHNFLTPSIFLFIVLGCGNTAFAVNAIYRKTGITFIVNIALGIILVLWIILQVRWIGYLNWLQPFYIILGMMQISLGTYLFANK